MPRNSLLDLHNLLFEQMERLNDEDLTDEQLDKEIKRSKAMGDIAKVAVDNSKTILEAQKYQAEYGLDNHDTPSIFNEKKEALQIEQKG